MSTKSPTPSQSLAGKVALITGASSGIGREIAIAYAAAGAFIACVDLAPTAPKPAAEGDTQDFPTHDVLNSQFAAPEGGPSRAIFVQCNVTSATSVEAAVARTVAEYGRLDIMVNNAGILAEAKTEKVFPRIHETPESVWDADMAVNGKGVWLGCKYAVAQMLRQEPHAGGDRGWIINMSSIVGIVGFAGTSSYTASKGAVVQLTKAVALEYAKDRIHVNSLHPGFTDTSMLEPLKVAHGAEAAKAMLAGLHPWGTMGRAQDVAKVAVFLAGDGVSWCTGAPFIVDGGYTAQ